MTRARLLGGAAWTDGPLTVTDGPDGLNIMFPTDLDPDAVGRVVAVARERHTPVVGAWLNVDTDPTALAAAGFERGWDPWWMTRSLDGATTADDPRVTLHPDRPAAHVVRRRPSRGTVRRARLVAPGGRRGRSFEMEVWPPFRRIGVSRTWWWHREVEPT